MPVQVPQLPVKSFWRWLFRSTNQGRWRDSCFPISHRALMTCWWRFSTPAITHLLCCPEAEWSTSWSVGQLVLYLGFTTLKTFLSSNIESSFQLKFYYRRKETNLRARSSCPFSLCALESECLTTTQIILRSFTLGSDVITGFPVGCFRWGH